MGGDDLVAVDTNPDGLLHEGVGDRVGDAPKLVFTSAIARRTVRPTR